MPIRTVLALGVFLPAMVAAVVFALARSARGRAMPGAWGGAIALPAAFLLGRLSSTGWRWPSFPPTDSTDWLVYAAPVAGLLGLLAAVWEMPRAAAWVKRVAVSGALVALLVRPLAQHTWTPGHTVAWIAAATIGIALLWWALDIWTRKAPGPATAFWLLVIGSAGAGVLVFGHSARDGQSAGALTAGLGAAWVVSLLFRRRGVLARGAVPVLALLLPGLWLSGHLFASVSLVQIALLAVAPVLAALTTRGPLSRGPAGRVALVRALAVLLPVCIAAGLAFQAWNAIAPGNYEEYGL